MGSLTSTFPLQHRPQVIFKMSPFERRMEKTEAESVDDIVAASRSEVSSPMFALGMVKSSTHQIKNQ
jgi:hypothetical protein